MGRQLPQTRSVEGINYKLKACSLKEVSTHFIFNKNQEKKNTHHLYKRFGLPKRDRPLVKDSRMCGLYKHGGRHRNISTSMVQGIKYKLVGSVNSFDF